MYFWVELGKNLRSLQLAYKQKLEHDTHVIFKPRNPLADFPLVCNLFGGCWVPGDVSSDRPKSWSEWDDCDWRMLPVRLKTNSEELLTDDPLPPPLLGFLNILFSAFNHVVPISMWQNFQIKTASWTVNISTGIVEEVDIVWLSNRLLRIDKWQLLQ